jgi:Tol biopolymer transport system component
MLFLKRPDSPDEVPISLPSANILSISKTGEMAIALACRESQSHQGVCRGALAQAPITGGAARPIADDVQQADWTPDGGSLVVARDVGGRGRVEFPIGKVLFETVGHVSFPRFSPKGDRIAFFDHPLKVDSRGSVAVVDLAGHKRTLTQEWTGVEGLAWSPSGEEIWFTGAPAGGTTSSLYAVSLTGRERLLARLPEGFRIHDVSRSGRVLMTLDNTRVGIVGRVEGESRDRDLSWLNWSNARDISRDGKTLLFDEEAFAAGPNYATCIRGMDGSPVVRLGEGAGLALSPSGGWAVAQLSNPTGSPLMLLATRTGERRLLPTGGLSADEVEWLDEKRIVLAGSSGGRPPLLYVQDVGQGDPRAISTENVEANFSDRIAPSPDGRFVAAVGPEHKCRLYPVAGGASRDVAGVAPGEFPVRWSEDGRWLYIRGVQDAEPPVRLYRVEPQTGRREVWTVLMPADPAGLSGIGAVALAPDGKTYAYSYGTNFSQLVLADGIN